MSGKGRLVPDPFKEINFFLKTERNFLPLGCQSLSFCVWQLQLFLRFAGSHFRVNDTSCWRGSGPRKGAEEIFQSLLQSGGSHRHPRWMISIWSLSERASVMSLTHLTQGLLTPGLGEFCVIPKECVVGAHFSFVWTPTEAEVSCQNDLDTGPSESQPSWLSQLLPLNVESLVEWERFLAPCRSGACHMGLSMSMLRSLVYGCVSDYIVNVCFPRRTPSPLSGFYKLPHVPNLTTARGDWSEFHRALAVFLAKLSLH